MKRKIILYGAALSLLAVSCNKDSVAPTPEPSTDGIPADVVAVLKKHHCNYAAAPVLSSKQDGHKPTFANAQELDSLLTRIEKRIRTLRLVPQTIPSKAGNRIEHGVGGESFTVAPGPGLTNTAYEPWTNLRATVLYTYCTGDGFFRTSELTDVSLNTGTPGDSELIYANTYKFTQTYTTRVDFNFGGQLTFKLYMPNSSNPIITSWSVDFKGSVYPGGLISDNDTCGEELPPSPPTLGTGSSGGSGGSGGGAGSGGSNGGGPHDGGWEDYPWPQGPIPGTGGGGAHPTDHPTTTPEPTDPAPPGPKDDEPVA
jgi:hypothetical protein